MTLRQTISDLFLSDPALQWMREQDSPRAKRAYGRSAIVAVILAPLLSIQPSAYDTGIREIGFSWMGAMGITTAIFLFFLMSSISQTRAFVRYPVIELTIWWFTITVIAAIGYGLGAARIGAPLVVSENYPLAAQIAARELALSSSQHKTAIVAWIYTAHACLALLLAIRGQPVKPLPFAIFVSICVAFLYFDESILSRTFNAFAFMIFFSIIVVIMNSERYARWSRAFEAHQHHSLDKENDTILISSFLAPQVHERLRRNERVADSFSNLTVIFADMVGFTSLSRRVSPGHLVDVLNEIFAAGDEIAAECGIEKVKTIGDCYMAVAGGIASPECGSADAIGFARRYLEKVEEVSLRLDIPLALRVGIHTGPAVGGIIGTSRPAYDYWGETVNLASRLESASGAGRILVSEATWLQTKRDFEFEDGTDIEAKGVGTVRSHFVAQARAEANIVPLVKRSK